MDLGMSGENGALLSFDQSCIFFPNFLVVPKHAFFFFLRLKNQSSYSLWALYIKDCDVTIWQSTVEDAEVLMV